MAKSNFLTFIKESSSEEAIFKAILQRSKGSKSSSVINIFSVVLSVGIEAVRDEIEKLDKNISTSEKIKQVVAQLSLHHIPNSKRIFWSHIAEYVMPKQSNFTKEEQKMMFVALVVCRPESVGDNNFEISTATLETYKDFSEESFDAGIVSVPGVVITEEESDRVGFTSWEEFKAFLAVSSNGSNESIKSVFPTFLGVASSDLSPQVYAENRCESPYRRIGNET